MTGRTNELDRDVAACRLAKVSLMLAVACVLFGPFAFLPAILCGHSTLEWIRKRRAVSGWRTATRGLVVAYICALAVSLTAVSVVVSGQVTALTEICIVYWTWLLFVFAVAGWFVLLAKRPVLLKYVTLLLISFGTLATIFVMNLERSRYDARVNQDLEYRRRISVGIGQMMDFHPNGRRPATLQRPHSSHNAPTTNKTESEP